MTKKVEPHRLAFDAKPDLIEAIDHMRDRYGLTRKAFLDGVLRSLFKLPNPVSTWVDSQVNKEGAN